jgi:hypothetical protein
MLNGFQKSGQELIKKVMPRKIMNIKNGGAVLFSGLMLGAPLTAGAAITNSSPRPLIPGSVSPQASLLCLSECRSFFSQISQF